MALWRKTWRGRAFLCTAAIALVLGGPLLAQETAGTSAILIIDQNRLFVESAFGKASIAREQDFLDGLAEENKRIEADLVAEEQALTEQRKTLSAADFAALAEAFDQKVEKIRAEQDSKAAGLVAQRDADRKVFVQAIRPIVAELMDEQQAVAIVDKSLVILSLSSIDVTDEAIARVDAALPPGLTGPAAP
jgi:Skp family chaperone for outer membrane proteins